MTLGWLWWRAWAPLVACGAAALFVAGMALGDIHLSHTTLSHPSLSHTALSHIIFHTQLCITPSFAHNFVTHHFSQIRGSWSALKLGHTCNFHTHTLTTLSHTIFHTHNFVTHTHIFHTHNFITHNSSDTFCLTSRSSTTSFVFPSFPVPLQLLFLLIGRSCLVGLSSPSISNHTVTGMSCERTRYIYIYIYIYNHLANNTIWVCTLGIYPAGLAMKWCVDQVDTLPELGDLFSSPRWAIRKPGAEIGSFPGHPWFPGAGQCSHVKIHCQSFNWKTMASHKIK